MKTKLTIGDKVKIPKSKRGVTKPYYSNIVNRADKENQDFLYYVGMEDHLYILSNECLPSGDYFEERDGIELYDEFKLPEKWCILRTEDNHEEINDWFRKFENNKMNFSFHSADMYITSDHINCETWITTSYKKPTGYTEITFEQFKKYVLNKKDMGKQIIGYTLVKPEYKKASEQIMNTYFPLDNFRVTVPSCISKLKQVDVLDLWFEPIYEEERVSITLSNGKLIILEKGKDFFEVEGEKIPINTIKDILKTFKSFNGKRLGTWDIELVDVKLNVGCWKGITKSDIE